MMKLLDEMVNAHFGSLRREVISFQYKTAFGHERSNTLESHYFLVIHYETTHKDFFPGKKL